METNPEIKKLKENTDKLDELKKLADQDEQKKQAYEDAVKECRKQLDFLLAKKDLTQAEKDNLATIKTSLEVYESALNKLKSGILENITTFIKENPGKSIGGIAVVGGIIGAVSSKKGFFSRIRGGITGAFKGTLLGGLGVGAYSLFTGGKVGKFFGDAWDTVKGWFGRGDKTKGTGAGTGDVMDDTKEGVKSLEDVYTKAQGTDTDALKAKETIKSWSALGNAINVFNDTINTFPSEKTPTGIDPEDRLGAGKEKGDKTDIDYCAVLPHVLDNTFSSIDDMQSCRGWINICAHGTFQETKEKLEEMITKSYPGVASILSLIGISDVKNITENDLTEIHRMFSKILDTMTYTTYLENYTLSKDLVERIRKGEKIFKGSTTNLSEEGIDTKDPAAVATLVNKMSTMPSLYHIGTTKETAVSYEEIQTNIFRGKKLGQITDIPSYQDLLVYNPQIGSKIKPYNDEREKLKADLTDTNKSTILENLKKQAGEKLADAMCGGLFGTLREYLPIIGLTQAFGAGEEGELRKQITNSAGYKEMLTDIQGTFEQNKTASVQDIQNVIDRYETMLKGIELKTAAMDEMMDEDGNFVLNTGHAITNTVSTGYKKAHVGLSLVITGIEEIVNGEVWGGTKDILAGAPGVFLGGGVMALGAGGVLALFGKGGIQKAGVKMVRIGGSAAIGGPIGPLVVEGVRGLYNRIGYRGSFGPQRMMRDITLGNITLEQAYKKIPRAIKTDPIWGPIKGILSADATPDSQAKLLGWLCKQDPTLSTFVKEADGEILAKYRGKERFHKEIIKIGDKKSFITRWKEKIYNNGTGKVYEIGKESLDQVRVIENRAQKSGILRSIIDKFTGGAKELDILHSIAADPDLSKILETRKLEEVDHILKNLDKLSPKAGKKAFKESLEAVITMLPSSDILKQKSLIQSLDLDIAKAKPQAADPDIAKHIEQLEAIKKQTASLGEEGAEAVEIMLKKTGGSFKSTKVLLEKLAEDGSDLMKNIEKLKGTADEITEATEKIGKILATIDGTVFKSIDEILPGLKAIAKCDGLISFLKVIAKVK